VWQIYQIFASKNIQLLKIAFISYVRPSLEYCSIIWSPYLLQDINFVENVQKRSTKSMCKNKRLYYAERLSLLQLESLEERRLKIDLIETFKILHFQKNNTGYPKTFSRNPYSHKPYDL